MRPTRVSVLLLTAAAAALVGYALAALAYVDLSPLPVYSPATLVLLALVELGMARVVRERLRRGRDPRATPRRPLHALQVARAAVLARASSSTGAALSGGYAGIAAWVLRRRGALAGADTDSLVAGLSCLAALALVFAALWLERSCRTPDQPQPDDRLSSRA